MVGCHSVEGLFWRNFDFQIVPRLQLSEDQEIKC